MALERGRDVQDQLHIQPEHDDADPADEVLRQVEQAQQDRPQERQDRETDHKLGDREAGVEAGGEAAVGPLSPPRAPRAPAERRMTGSTGGTRGRYPR